jgi:uracil-DNA glycosylase family 4
MAVEPEQQLRAYVEYLRDLGVHDFYRQGEPSAAEVAGDAVRVALDISVESQPVVESPVVEELKEAPPSRPSTRPVFLEPPIAKLVSFDDLAPLPESRVAPPHKADALVAIQEEIGDCTRCPLAYAGRRKIVFGDGDANARLMFVGEGPGADEDIQGLPFVGKAGQLLNNMIAAMGIKREQVYIANIVKCRPPNNRTPEPVEANTCDQFLLQQIDVVQPEVIVALGSTAATYLLGVKQSLSGLRGRWHRCRGAKLAVTYHPAYLLRDPGMKAEAWKDLQMVMKEMGLKAPAKG